MGLETGNGRAAMVVLTLDLEGAGQASLGPTAYFTGCQNRSSAASLCVSLMSEEH